MYGCSTHPNCTGYFIYRAMKHELRHPTFLCEELDNGNICPACPKVSMMLVIELSCQEICAYCKCMLYMCIQESGKLVLSFDALFGLPRKVAAGTSYRKPLHGNLMFCEQSMVDAYVSTYPKPRKVTKVRLIWNIVVHYILYSFALQTRNVVTSQLEVLCVQPVGTMPLMKLVYSAVHVDMSSQGCLWTSSMEKGILLYCILKNLYNNTYIVIAIG